MNHFIEIKGARVNNLKTISVKIPRNKFVVIAGVSGSGKSSLAFDTLYAAGQRRYVESLSSYARQFLNRMNKPECDFIRGIPPAIAIEQTYKEVLDFAQFAYDNFQYVKLMLTVKDADKFEVYRTKLIQCEEITDKYEYELAAFLSKLSAEKTSPEENQEIKALYRVISELESLGDSCENISRLFVRLKTHTKGFNKESSSKLALLIGKVNQAFVAMITNLKAAQQGTLTQIDNAITIEQGINETRDVLREEGILQIERQSGNYQSMNYYLDMLEQLEAMGDFIINVSQSVLKVKE